MDVGASRAAPAGPAATPAPESGVVQHQDTTPLKEQAVAAVPRTTAPVPKAPARTLRLSGAASRSSARVGPPRDLEKIKEKLGPQGVKARRDEAVKEKESVLRNVVDGHDTAVREKFHLERYISLLDGWDPEHVKQEQSDVFLDYKRAHHNLLDLIPPSALPSTAGPSRPRPVGAARATRRQVHQQQELFAVPTPAPAPAPQPNGHPTPPRGKGRLQKDGPVVEQQVKNKSKSKGRAAVQASSDMPPPVANKGKGKSRRATMGDATPALEPEAEDDASEPSGQAKGKKRARQSLPALPAKKLRAQVDESGTASPSQSSPLPTRAQESTPPPPPPPTPLPSLAHLPFPPRPVRPRERITGPRWIWYTDPTQLPVQQPQYNGDLRPIINSYFRLEDTGPPPTLEALQTRAAREAYFRNRVNYLQHHGRLLRLLDQDDVGPVNRSKSHRAQVTIPPRKQDYRDALLSHMVQVRNAIMSEAKSKPLVCKKIARMITAYWEHEANKEERERLAEEKERKKKAKELVRSVRRRWNLAVKIIRARVLEAQKAEQDRLGKEHLQNMLERSRGMLEAQREDIIGGEHEQDEDADMSDATDGVSAAEDSEDEEHDGDERESGPEADESDSGSRSGVDSGSGSEDESGKDGEGGEDDEETGIRALLVQQEQDEAEVENESPVETVPQSAIEDPAVTVALGVEDLAAEKPKVVEVLPVDVPAPAAPIVESPVVEISAVHEAAEPLKASVDVATLKGVPQPSAPTARVPSPSIPAPVEVKAPVAETARVNTEAVSLPIVEKASEALVTVGIPSEAQSLVEAAPVETALSTRPVNVTPGPFEKAPNGQQQTVATLSPPPSSPVIRAPSSRRRARTSRSVSITVKTEDPDANDVEFEEDDDELSEKDHALDVEMEEEEKGAGGYSEDEGLLADADLPIEELLKRYGYSVPGAEEPSKVVEESDGAVGEAKEVNDEMDQVIVEPRETKDDVETDKSLLDDALARQPSPGLIVQGKRARRVRSVWTPEDNPAPPPPQPKRPKVEEVNEEIETTPELSSEEETDEDDDDDDEDEEGEGDDGGVEAEPEDPDKVHPPFLLRGTLRPYQQAGLEWLASLYANNMNGILADEMGLGKTIQTIALLGHLACDKGVWGQHLIIVPTSVILNWEMEFKKFLPGLKILTYYGNQKERKEKRRGWHTENTWQVCITSYQIVLADQHIFRRKSWVYMILDEAHNIKNFRSQRWQTLLGFKAQRRLLLTGTPLQNNLMELWSLLYFLMPNGVTADATAVVGFANHKEFSEWFSNPMDKAIETGDTLDEETIETVNKLHTLLRPFILRRLKSEVETQLPGKFEHVVYCKLSKRQRFLYDEFMSRASTRDALTSGGYLGVVNTLMQLRKVCNHPDLFEVRPVKTSFAMEHGVAADFEPEEILVRKRLLQNQDQVSLESFNLVFHREKESKWAWQSRKRLDASHLLPHAVEVVATTKGARKSQPQPPKPDTRDIDGWLAYRAWTEEQASIARWRALRDINQQRCGAEPIYGATLLDVLSALPNPLLPGDLPVRTKADMIDDFIPPVAPLISSFAERAKQVSKLLDYYAVMPPNVVARDLPRYALAGLEPVSHPELLEPEFDTLHHATVKLQIAFPDLSLLQYDCGKLQKLDEMLRDLKAGGHRVLIFTQMTRVLDILEQFLSYNGHRYLRLDGSTKIEDRQIITERFNSDSRIFCFIASSRSGGVGINLTGADTVFFYDSDWNPSMDRQCMDRAHRIGQTREVHIYRFVSIHTVEENMLKKANQKRLLDRVVIQEGDFTTEFFGKMDWRDIIETEGDGQRQGPHRDDDDHLDNGGNRVEDVDVEEPPIAVDAETTAPRAGEERDFARALAEVEDEEDAAAARMAQGEGELDIVEFEESSVAAPRRSVSVVDKRAASIVAEGESPRGTPVSSTPFEAEDGGGGGGGQGGGDEDGEEEEDDVGAVDEYMLRTVEWDWDYFSQW